MGGKKEPAYVVTIFFYKYLIMIVVHRDLFAVKIDSMRKNEEIV